MARIAYFESISSLYKQPNFAWFMGGRAISLIGMWAQKIAIGWLTWELTGSTFWLGAIAFAELFPTVVITPVAGVIADRVNRLKMLRLCQTLVVIHAFVLSALTFSGYIEIWSLFVLNLIFGTVLAFSTSARLTTVPNLMEARYLPTAIGIDSSFYNTARVIGPMIAAPMISLIGTGATFLFNGICYAVYLIFLFRIHLVRTETSGRAGNVFAQTAEGMRYAARHPGIGPALFLLVAATIGIKPFLEMLPGLADGVFGAGVEGFAIFAATAGGGAIVGSVWMAARGAAKGTTRIAFGSMILGVVGVFTVCATHILWVGLFGIFLVGGAMTLAGTSIQVLIQTSVEGAVRGRVMSLYGMLHRGAPALGAVIIGVAAEWAGLQMAMIGGGVVTGIVFILMLRRYGTMVSALESRNDQV